MIQKEKIILFFVDKIEHFCFVKIEKKVNLKKRKRCAEMRQANFRLRVLMIKRLV